jgi:hypothetical protein
MGKVKLYRITITKAYRMDEQQTYFSLEPWNGNNAYYEGCDDGGQEYVLPGKCRVGETIGGQPAIFWGDDYCILSRIGSTPTLTHLQGTLCLVHTYEY